MDELAAILSDRPTLNHWLSIQSHEGVEAANQWLQQHVEGGVSQATLAGLQAWHGGSRIAGSAMAANPAEFLGGAQPPRDPTLPRAFRYLVTAEYDAGGGRAISYRSVYIDSDVAYTQDALEEAAFDLIEAEYGEAIPSGPADLGDQPVSLSITTQAVWQR